MDEFYRYPNNDYNEGIRLSEYNGSIELSLAQEVKDGKVYSKFCYPQKYDPDTKERKPLGRSIPWKIALGGKSEAVQVLRFFLQILEEGGKDTGAPF